MILLGGYNRQLLLFSKHELVLNECEFGEGNGSCRLKIMTPTKCSENCEGCGKTIQ